MRFQLISTLACLAGFTQAANLRALEKEPDSAMRELTNDYGYAFLYESKAKGGGFWLGYDDSKRADIDDSRNKFVHHNFHLEEYDDKNGKTGECYEMDRNYRVYLKDCDYDKVGQKWLISKAPYHEYGQYYIISNAYYGYVIEYDSGSEYYLGARSWKDVDYNNKDYIHKILFYKEAAYDMYENNACRTWSGGNGRGGGDDYILYDKTADRAECKKICSADEKCKGWEYSKNRCEIWFTKPTKFDSKSGFDCYVKQD
jgi:hypothetical protein